MTARHASIGLLSLIHAVACFDLWMTFSSGTLLPQSDGLTLILSVVLQAGSALYLTVQVRGNRLPAFNLTRFARAGGYALLVSLLGGSMLVSAGWLGRPVARVFFFTALAGTASVGYVLSAGIVTFPGGACSTSSSPTSSSEPCCLKSACSRSAGFIPLASSSIPRRPRP